MLQLMSHHGWVAVLLLLHVTAPSSTGVHSSSLISSEPTNLSANSRSGLVQDDFDQSIKIDPHRIQLDTDSSLHESPSHHALYPRDHPEALVPFEEVNHPPSGQQESPNDWMPNWPRSELVTPLPTEKMPTIFHFPKPSSIEMPVEKVPISQYFFDISDAATRVPGPLHDPTMSVSRVSSDVPHTRTPTVDIHNFQIRDENIVTEKSVTDLKGATVLQSSLLGSHQTNLLSKTGVESVTTPTLSLTNGLDIAKIYSSAFFPTAEPSISASQGDLTQVINSVVSNDISSGGHGSSPRPSSVKVLIDPVSEGESTGSSSLATPLASSSAPIEESNTPSPTPAQTQYSLGTQIDDELLFGAGDQHSLQDDTRQTSDELSLNSGDLSLLPFALPTPIRRPTVQPSITFPSSESTTKSLIINSISSKSPISSVVSSPISRIRITNRPNVISSKNPSESRKPLWMLLSKTNNMSDTTKFTPTSTPTVVDMIRNADEDIPVGILSNRPPTQTHTLPSDNGIIFPQHSSSSNGISLHPSTSISPTLSPSVTPASPPPPQSTPTLPDDLPLPHLILTTATGSTAPTSKPELSSIPPPSSSGGFTPLISDLHQNEHVSSIDDVVSHHHSSSHTAPPILRSDLLLDTPDMIVHSSLGGIVSPSSTSTFGTGFTFRLHTPTIGGGGTTLSSVILGVTPKSNGWSGFDGPPPRVGSSQPFDFSTFETLNTTTASTESGSTFEKQPTTYVYPQELLPMTNSTTEEVLTAQIEASAALDGEGASNFKDNESSSTNPSIQGFSTLDLTEATLGTESVTPSLLEIETQTGTVSSEFITETTLEIEIGTDSTQQNEILPVTLSEFETSTPATQHGVIALSGVNSLPDGDVPPSKPVSDETNTESTLYQSSTLKITTPTSESTTSTSESTTSTSESTTSSPESTTSSPESTTSTSESTTSSPESTTSSFESPQDTISSTELPPPLPYIRAVLDANLTHFCQHQNKYNELLTTWLRMRQPDTLNSSIKFFGSPNCKEKKTTPMRNEATPLGGEATPPFHTKTTVLFYVSTHGVIDTNLTEGYPLYPTDTPPHLSQYTVSQLELVHPTMGVASDVSSPSHALSTAAIIGIIAASVALIISVTFIVVFVLYRRNKAKEKSYAKRCTPVSMDAYSVDSVSVYHSFRRKQRHNRSNRSIKSYLNQGFEDPNGPSRPLDFARLTHFISDMDGVHEEFGTIPAVTVSYDDLPPNVQEKNRYANVIPIPETRVLLKGFKDSPEKQYINANYVRGPHNEERHYIATQAPLESTVGEFWRMIWEQECRVIVMLTDFVERGIDRCADYLPPSQTLDCHRVYGDFQVTLKSQTMQDKFVLSGVLLKNLENSLVRDLTHLWYTGWPSTGVPHTEKPFISFVLAVRRARKQSRSKGPIVVHCSPGTGRTGTFISIDHSMRHFEDDRSINIPATVYGIRRERAGAVQTSEQYAFIYRVVNLYASKLSAGTLDSL